MQTFISQRICPVCGAPLCRKICNISFAKLLKEKLSQSFDVVVCCNCGFCYDDILSSQSIYDDYYKFNTKYLSSKTLGAGGLSKHDIERYDIAINTCEKYIRSKSKILDIGAGNGGLLKYIMYNSKCEFLYGVEPSIGNKKIDGINFFNSIDDINNIKFDIIFCTHVIEHIYDIKQFLNKIKIISKVNTVFFVEVPNAECYLHGYKAPYYYFDREHINHFTPQSLKNLLILNGFSIIKCREHKNISILFENCDCDIYNTSLNKLTPANITNIEIYCNQSKKMLESIKFQKYNHPIVCWGFGAYFRMLYLKNDFPKNISVIIDRDRCLSRERFYGASFASKNILQTDKYKNSTVIITSVRYNEEIKQDLKSMKFRGDIVDATIMTSQ